MDEINTDFIHNFAFYLIWI